MPEMPEVETIRSELKEKIKGKKIVKAEIINNKPLVNFSADAFVKAVEGKTITAIKRRSKIIIVNLSSGQSLLIHLKMTGRLLYQNVDAPIDKFTHVIFKLDDGHELHFWDFRKFGYIKLVSGLELSEIPELAELGPEALELSLDEFEKLLATRKRGKIKPLLMEQNFISGLGNVYSDEVLFYAGVQSLRTASSLSSKEVSLIYEGIQKILPAAIKHRGSSVDTYVDIFEQQGEYVPYLQVYRREGKPCSRCGASIERIKIGGRSGHFCPKCQK
jgi:formamidopyrimidine-DNA glycosylase